MNLLQAILALALDAPKYIVAVAAVVILAGCGKQRAESSFRKWIEGMPLSALSNMPPVRAAVVDKSVRKVEDPDGGPDIWIGDVTLKRPDGTRFLLGGSHCTPAELMFYNRVVVGRTYSLPEDFVALLRHAEGDTNVEPATAIARP